MAAYGALVSLMNIIETLQHHPCPPITLDKAQTQSLTEKIALLQDFLESYNFHGGNRELESLQIRIADAAHAAEDVIESHIVDQIHAQSASTREGEEISAFEFVQKLIKGMDFIKREVKEIITKKVDITEQIQNHPCPPTALDKKQVESENIAILLDFVEAYNSHDGNHEVQCLLNRIANAAEDSIASDAVGQILTENIAFLQNLFNAYNSLESNHEDECLRTRIADAAYAAKDNIESPIVDLILGLSTLSIDTDDDGENTSSVDFYQRLRKLIEDIDLIEEEVKEIRNRAGFEDQVHITVKPPGVSSRSPSTGQNIMVGFDDVLHEILDKLTGQRSDRQIIPIVGMGGIGKTVLARNVYENPLIEQRFDISSWVTISQEYNEKDIILEILCQKNKEIRDTLSGKREEDLGLQLYKYLWGRRYLIIMDDMWSIDVWDKVKKFFPDNDCGSRIIVTTRLSKLALELSGTRGLEMNFLDEESSWILLSKTVFGKEGCPLHDLEEIGKKIATNCKGLPLSIVVIGGLLAKYSDAPKYWEYVAGNLISIVNLEDDERCYKTLHTSYNLLPVHLKPCFLYMGIFPEDHEISVSELIKLWVAEGFLKSTNGKSLEMAAEEYLRDLIDRNLVLVRKLGTSSEKVKSCTIHDLLRDLCLKEAHKEKFLCVTTQNGLIPEGITTQRRFVIHGTTLTEVHKFKKVAFQFASLARSFIFDFSEVLPSLNSRLLRVLKVVDRCRYFEPRERFNIDAIFDDFVNSRHLAIHFASNSAWSISFPSSAYFLWNLQTLIVGGPLHCVAAPEIWKMPLLKHVKFHKLYLPNPPSADIDGKGDFVLWKLQTLSIICNFKFGEGVIKRIPNIRKLKLSYEAIEEGIEVASHYCLSNLGNLHKLESLAYFFDNVPSRSDLLQNLTFPHSLKKLTLSGSKLNWEDMSTKIGPLPLLEVLKLQEFSVRGPRWETIEGQFCNLRFLLINFSFDLEYWITESTHFPRLEHLVLRYLGSLKEIPSCFGDISTLQSMKVEFCSDGAVISAKNILEEQLECGNESFQVQVMSWGKDQHEEMKGLPSPNFQVKLHKMLLDNN